MQGDIQIFRPGRQDYYAPITPGATRVWQLMEEDSVTLKFNVESPEYFKIGDYVETDWGTFYLTDEPLPAEFHDGQYTHTLVFEKDYRRWKNQLFQMTYHTEEEIQRKEGDWKLTDVLQSHMDEFLRNLWALGFLDNRLIYKYGYCIDGKTLRCMSHFGRFIIGEITLPAEYQYNGVDNLKEMAYIQYQGCDLLAGLKAICDAYKCEWWVKDINLTVSGREITVPILCLGKCEYGDYVNFKLSPENGDYANLYDAEDRDIYDADDKNIYTDDIVVSGADGVVNVERMTLNRNDKEYANRLYVYGANKNIPDTYRKELIFEASRAFQDVKSSWYGQAFIPAMLGAVKANGSLESSSVIQYQARFSINIQKFLRPGDVIRYLGAMGEDFACIAYKLSTDVDSSWHVVLAGAGTDSEPAIQGFSFIVPENVSSVIIQNRLTVDEDGNTSTAQAQETSPYGILEIQRVAGNNQAFEDTNRPLSRGIIVSLYDFKHEQDSSSFDYNPNTHKGYTTSSFNISINQQGNYRLKFLVSQYLETLGSRGISYVLQGVTVKVDNNTEYNYTPETTIGDQAHTINIIQSAEFDIPLTTGDHSCVFVIEYGLYPQGGTGFKNSIEGRLEANYMDDIPSELIFEDTTYPIYFSNRAEHYKGFIFNGASPEGFGNGSKYTIRFADSNMSGLSTYKVPSNYYTSIEDVNSNYILGEKRLMLPAGIPFIGDPSLDRSEIVEKMIVFDAVYPKCALRIYGIREEVGNIVTEEYGDGSVKTEETANYYIALKRIDSSGTDMEFPFNSDMRVDGEDLQIKFLTPDEERKYTLNEYAWGDDHDGNYQLAGLTFNVAVVSFVDDEGTRWQGFQIARNKDFGAMFPNLSRKPKIGDPLILTGWNPKAMQALGLIGSAETELLNVGNAYKDLLENDQFTFDCTMMSDWMQSRINNDWIGQKARVFHRSLMNEDGLEIKESRVIGFRYKLDIPYDSPIYTIGETEAYSRLKALEREVSAEKGGTSVGGVISGTTPGGGGSGNYIEKVLSQVGYGYAKAQGLYDEINQDYYAVHGMDSGIDEHLPSDKVLATLADCYDYANGKLDHVVVGRCIPRYPKKGMAYCFPDGLVKVKVDSILGQVKAKYYAAVPNQNNQRKLSLQLVLDNTDTFRTLRNFTSLEQEFPQGAYKGPIIVQILADCEITSISTNTPIRVIKCPQGTLNTTSPYLIIENGVVVNNDEIQFEKIPNIAQNNYNKSFSGYLYPPKIVNNSQIVVFWQCGRRPSMARPHSYPQHPPYKIQKQRRIKKHLSEYISSNPNGGYFIHPATTGSNQICVNGLAYTKHRRHVSQGIRIKSVSLIRETNGRKKEETDLDESTFWRRV